MLIADKHTDRQTQKHKAILVPGTHVLRAHPAGTNGKGAYGEIDIHMTWASTVHI